MPILPKSDYRPGFFLWNGHVQTVYPVLLRPDPPVSPRRERISTPDGDFLDLDWHAAAPGTAPRGRPRLAVIGHGLEGHSRRKYAAGMARALTRRGWDALAWNLRGCSGEINTKRSFYHSGFTDDLDTVVRHAITCRPSAEIALIGFSIGGNMVLKYLGEDPDRVPAAVRRAVALSVPCDLAGAARVLEKRCNRIYEVYFLRSLKAKIRAKNARMGPVLDVSRLDAIRTLAEFDDRYTAPMFGFAGASEYYRKASCLPHLESIRVPSLVLNAADDPFFSQTCFPRRAAVINDFLTLEIPRTGGHVGFVVRNADNEYWSESRTADFLENG